MLNHMQPSHYLLPYNKPIVTPRYVLKIIDSSGSTQVQIYYCHQTLLQDVMLYWGYQDIIIQKFICQKSLKPSIARFYANRQTVYKAESCCSNFVAIKDNLEFCQRITEQCGQVLNEKVMDEKNKNARENRLMKSFSKALTQSSNKLGISFNLGSPGQQPHSPQRGAIIQKKIVVKIKDENPMKKIIGILTKIAENQQR